MGQEVVKRKAEFLIIGLENSKGCRSLSYGLLHPVIQMKLFQQATAVVEKLHSDILLIETLRKHHPRISDSLTGFLNDSARGCWHGLRVGTGTWGLIHYLERPGEHEGTLTFDG